MSGVAQSTFTVILSVEFITGNLGNVFIALVSCMDWARSRKISVVDQILAALAISRIGVLWLMLVNWWVSVLYPAQLKTRKTVKIVYITLTISNHFNIWLATCLFILYFLKIANFSNSIFLYLKWRIKKVVSGTLLVSLFLLFLNVVLMNTQIDVWIDRYKGNMTCHYSKSNLAIYSKLLLFTHSLFMFIPFSVSLMTFLLLTFSLWKHLKRMQHRAKGSRDTSTAVHVKALQTVIAFLLLYTIFFLSFLVQVWSSDIMDKNMILLLCEIAEISFPSGHSYVLILGNRKLRQASLSVLWWLKCKVKDMETLGP